MKVQAWACVGALTLAAAACGGGDSTTNTNTGSPTTSSTTSTSSGGGGSGGSTTSGTGGSGGQPAASYAARGELVNGGQVLTSPNYRMVFSLGQASPAQGSHASPSYQLRGGVIGRTE